jgi:hypothetical protein
VSVTGKENNEILSRCEIESKIKEIQSKQFPIKLKNDAYRKGYNMRHINT